MNYYWDREWYFGGVLKRLYLRNLHIFIYQEIYSHNEKLIKQEIYL
jgi:hypothetical protein